jgi:hypothetical protein
MIRLPRVHQCHTTSRTAGNLAAVTTDEGTGIALPVEKQQDAGPTTDRLPDGPNERLAQHRAAIMIA